LTPADERPGYFARDSSLNPSQTNDQPTSDVTREASSPPRTKAGFSSEEVDVEGFSDIEVFAEIDG
jgi:hypothetical protein